jgi:hypothetical protein
MYAQGSTSTVTSLVGALYVVPYNQWVHVRLEARVTIGALTGTGTGRLVTSTGVDETVNITRGDVNGNKKTRTIVGLQRFDTATNVALEVIVDNIVGGAL